MIAGRATTEVQFATHETHAAPVGRTSLYVYHTQDAFVDVQRQNPTTAVSPKIASEHQIAPYKANGHHKRLYKANEHQRGPNVVSALPQTRQHQVNIRDRLEHLLKQQKQN